MSENIVLTDYSGFLETQLSCRLPRWDELPELDLYMDQVITLMNKYIGDFSSDKDAQLTPSMINNYVKHCIIPSPVKKKYGRVHLSRLLIICALKPVLPISDIAEMIDRLLLIQDDKQLHNFFADHYENTFAATIESLREYTEKAASEKDVDTMLSLTALRAASISCAGRFLAVNAMKEQERREYGSEE